MAEATLYPNALDNALEEFRAEIIAGGGRLEIQLGEATYMAMAEPGTEGQDIPLTYAGGLDDCRIWIADK